MTEILRCGGRSTAGTLMALAAATALALTGCTTDPRAGVPAEPAPPPGAPPAGVPDTGGTATPEAVAWTGSICEALIPVTRTLRTPPAVDVTAPDAAQQAYRDYLGEAQAQVEQAQQELAMLDAPPVEGGEELVQDVREQVNDLGADVTDAIANVDAADPANPVAIGQAVVAGGNLLGAVGNNVQAIGALTDDPELGDAVEQAPACDELRMVGNPS
jgi:hypothetical protein